MWVKTADMVRKRAKPEEMPERAPFGVVTVYRGRGNYLQRIEQFEKAIQAYDEALRWNPNDVRSLLGRSQARAKATHYRGALADAATATGSLFDTCILHNSGFAELEPDNLTAKQIRAQIEYEKRAFEKALVLAHRGMRERRYPPSFAETARHAEETIRECVSKQASKVLRHVPLVHRVELKRESVEQEPTVERVSRMQPHQTHQVQEMSRVEKQKANQISRIMASKHLERMAHDKFFLISLCQDERLVSANKQGSEEMKELAHNALTDLEKRQAVLRERRPLYAAQLINAKEKRRQKKARKERLTRTQRQHAIDAERLIKAAAVLGQERETAKCLESAEFAMEQISSIVATLLPEKEKYLQELYDIVGNAFLDQKRVAQTMSESDREKRAFVLLGLSLSREPSRDSVLRTRPPAPPRDVKHRIQALERLLSLTARPSERCYVLHELARLLSDTKQSQRARYFSIKCQSEARAFGLDMWLLNATFILARCHVKQNNRPEARAALLEGAALARSMQQRDVAYFFDTCANVSTEGEIASDEAELEKREKEMVSLMPDDDLKSAAKHLLRRMSTLPANRRFSIMPGIKPEDTPPPSAAGRRVSIMPRTQQPVTISKKTRHPLGFQDFDY